MEIKAAPRAGVRIQDGARGRRGEGRGGAVREPWGCYQLPPEEGGKSSPPLFPLPVERPEKAERSALPPGRALLKGNYAVGSLRAG